MKMQLRHSNNLCSLFLAAIFIALLPLKTLSLQQGEISNSVGVDYHRAQLPQWSCAASVSMIVEYLKGWRLTDCQVVSLSRLPQEVQLHTLRQYGPAGLQNILGRCCSPSNDPVCETTGS